jgi:hypothetical protein
MEKGKARPEVNQLKRTYQGSVQILLSLTHQRILRVVNASKWKYKKEAPGIKVITTVVNNHFIFPLYPGQLAVHG